jgi:hypothetical protein
MSIVTEAAAVRVSSRVHAVPEPPKVPAVAPTNTKSLTATPVTDEPNVAVTVTAGSDVVIPLLNPSLMVNATVVGSYVRAN